jgi:putative flavoprotein involved in K+ transport
MPEQIDTVIIGGGQAGLAASYCLKEHGRSHVILEQAARLANTWRNQRWDSFTLVTPNWQLSLPGYQYAGDEPDGFLARDEVVAYLEGYAASFQAPVRFGTRVLAVETVNGEYRIETTAGDYRAANVVIASGYFQQPKILPVSTELPQSIVQIHSSDYRNPQQLPPGAVLVVGSGQSGCQIAEELYQSGRKVYLSIGASSGRAPRRYRGKDITWWLVNMGFFERTVDKLPSPQAKFGGNPHASGKNGGHTLNLHQFVRDGVTLIGRIKGSEGAALMLAADVKDNLARIDKFEADLVKSVDDFIARSGLDAPEEILPQLRDGYAVEPPARLDLTAAGVTSIVWAMGYTFDYSWIHLPVLDADGYPQQQRGVTAYPGLYFVGLHWQYTAKSDLFLGVGEDAAFVAEQIAARR